MENYKIAFIGTPDFGAIILKELIKHYRPVLVITNPDKPKGRKNIIAPSPVKELALKHNIPVQHDFKNIEADLIITAAFGKIIPKEIIELPKYGCLNVHPSLLPKYRGASPIQTAILNGEKETGITIMLMDEKMDHGPVLAQIKHKIDNKDYPTLSKELAEKGAELLIQTIPKWLKGEIKPKKQEHKKATFTKIIKREDGRIDWNKTPQEIERQIRAFNPWPGTFTFSNDRRIKILEAEIVNNELSIKKVQPEGKRPMSYEDFKKGYGQLF